MRLTEITFPWADGEYTFDLKLGQVRKIQEVTGLGPPAILSRLQTDQWKVDDYREVILQGLLGAGKTAEDARKLLTKWVDERPAKESLIPAQAILMAWIVGGPKPKKVDEAKTQTETETMAPSDSTSTSSMDSVPQSDSPPVM